jgi:hypothetical protein
MAKRVARKRLNKFERLVRDAIALLIERGEIEIPPKETATLAANWKTVGQRPAHLTSRVILPTKDEAIEDETYWGDPVQPIRLSEIAEELVLE